MACLKPYEPINVLKPGAPDVWVVDGPEVRMRYFGLRLPFTTRMTVIRLPDGKLWLHSPTEPATALLEALAALGPIAFLTAPNRLHTTWLAAWHARFPQALAAGIAAEPAWRGGRLDVALDLAGPGPFPWADAIKHFVVPGGMFSEAIFFHRASRTLIVTDLIENFELCRVSCFWLRALLRLTGPLDPNGTAPPDMRWSFRRHRPELRAALAGMRAWGPERIILAHGRWYDVEARHELDRAFAWVEEGR